MDKEIKFRGLRVDNGEWAKGGHAVVEGHHFIITKDARLDYEEDGDTYLVFRGIIEVRPETVGQYIGRTDKKCTEAFPDGQAIYAGDIIHIWSPFYKKDMPRAEVFWNNTLVRFDIKTPDGLYHNWLSNGHKQGWYLEVIGDIHKNPELLEGK